MSEAGAAVRSLVFESGKASPEMTHDLKVLGGGKMQDGIKRLASFFMEEGRERGYLQGERTGTIKGVAGTLFVGSLIAGGCWIAERCRINKIIKEHEKEGMKIIRVMEQKASEEPEIIEAKEVE
ncbi:MAG: hypothetical protein ACI4DQ_08865 [Lachnospiraceae bacterium]